MGDLITRSDVQCSYAALSATLAVSRDAVLTHLDRGVRRMVLTLSAVMVASAVALVLVVWSAS
jgi:hypothetical protein